MLNQILNHKFFCQLKQFKISIQAKVGGKILARENIKAMRKDVTAKW